MGWGPSQLFPVGPSISYVSIGADEVLSRLFPLHNPLSPLPPTVWGERRRAPPKPDTEMMCSNSLCLPPSCCRFQRRRYPAIIGRVDGHTWGGDLIDPIEHLIGELDLSGA